MASYKSAKKGRGWHGDPYKHARAGRLGGKATARQYGTTSFYHDIGSLGGKMSPGNFKNNPNRAKLAGKKGGQARSRRAAATL